MAERPFERETALKQGPLGRGGLRVRRHPTLSWTDAAGAHSFVIERRERMGSAPNAGVRVDNAAVSRLHADLELLDDGLWVHDLGSKNGTFVNDVLVDRARLPDGGALRVGEVTISVNYAKAPTPVDLWPEDHFGGLVGGSPAMRELYFSISRIAPLSDTVLIHGETGSGKDLVARALHDASPRQGKPFVVFDCGATAEDLIEAELFGHVRGAFTGAVDDRIGSVETATGGTLFLDEIGELPLSMQPKLLRLLETKTFRPVGTTEHREADVRFVAATHRDLGELVNQGSFREDLYFRIASFVVAVPPLRARTEDLPALVGAFLGPAVSHATVAEIAAQAVGRAWPGNVRELRNFVKRAVALAELGQPAAAAEEGRPKSLPPMSVDTTLPLSVARDRVVAAFEKGYVKDILERNGRVVTAAAEAAGVDRSYLHRLIRKYGL